LRRGILVLFMIIERFEDRDPLPVYKRVRDGGVTFPDGLTYLNSWIEPNFDRCFQLMECDDLRLLQQWILNCRDFGMSFEIVPVVPSKETRDVVAPFLDQT
jgi:hypothetical protein